MACSRKRYVNKLADADVLLHSIKSGSLSHLDDNCSDTLKKAFSYISERVSEYARYFENASFDHCLPVSDLQCTYRKMKIEIDEYDIFCRNVKSLITDARIMEMADETHGAITSFYSIGDELNEIKTIEPWMKTPNNADPMRIMEGSPQQFTDPMDLIDSLSDELAREFFGAPFPAANNVFPEVIHVRMVIFESDERDEEEGLK